MTTLLTGLLIPLLGTMLGASFVFFMKRDMPERLQKALLGFASGVMVAASVLIVRKFGLRHVRFGAVARSVRLFCRPCLQLYLGLFRKKIQQAVTFSSKYLQISKKNCNFAPNFNTIMPTGKGINRPW